MKMEWMKNYDYEVDKWGGKYLRAPDIFFDIINQNKNNLIKLKDIANVRRGFTSGANDFYYLNDEDVKEWNIEKKFLRPIIFSLKEIECIEII